MIVMPMATETPTPEMSEPMVIVASMAPMTTMTSKTMVIMTTETMVT